MADPVMEPATAFVLAMYDEAVRAAAATARAERDHELRGRYVKKYDPQGLHTWSCEVGRVLALQELLMGTSAEQAPYDPPAARSAARREAEQAFVADVQGGADVWAAQR